MNLDLEEDYVGRYNDERTIADLADSLSLNVVWLYGTRVSITGYGIMQYQDAISTLKQVTNERSGAQLDRMIAVLEAR